jgi:hypothetical protein
MTRISFQTSLLFAPLAYAIHHIEEHILFNFRGWRLKYFANNNPIPTEAVVCILMAITLTYLSLHAVAQNKASAQSAILFLMATQLHNLLFHVGGTITFRDFSPGTITAVLLYLPVNVLILRKASAEAWIAWRSGLVLFLLGGAIFWLWELVSPIAGLVSLLCTWAWIAQAVFTGRSAPTASV